MASARAPDEGTVFISVNNSDKPSVLRWPGIWSRWGRACGTRAPRRTCGARRGGHNRLQVNEGRPNVADQVVNGAVQMIINTPSRASFFDDRMVRRRR